MFYFLSTEWIIIKTDPRKNSGEAPVDADGLPFCAQEKGESEEGTDDEEKEC